MTIIRSAIRFPVSTTVGVILVVLFGAIALNRIPVQLTPNVEDPIITVSMTWPGASPVEIEREIVQEQEAQVTSLRAQTAGQQAEIDGLKQERDVQQAQIADLEERLAALERAVGAGSQGQRETEDSADLPAESPFPRLPFALLGGMVVALGAVVGRRQAGGGR